LRPRRSNGCKYEDKCQFAHGYHELRSRPEGDRGPPQKLAPPSPLRPPIEARDFSGFTQGISPGNGPRQSPLAPPTVDLNEGGNWRQQPQQAQNRLPPGGSQGGNWRQGHTEISPGDGPRQSPHAPPVVDLNEGGNWRSDPRQQLPQQSSAGDAVFGLVVSFEAADGVAATVSPEDLYNLPARFTPHGELKSAVFRPGKLHGFVDFAERGAQTEDFARTVAVRMDGEVLPDGRRLRIQPVSAKEDRLPSRNEGEGGKGRGTWQRGGELGGKGKGSFDGGKGRDSWQRGGDPRGGDPRQSYPQQQQQQVQQQQPPQQGGNWRQQEQQQATGAFRGLAAPSEPGPYGQPSRFKTSLCKAFMTCASPPSPPVRFRIETFICSNG
jgi:hypothetical protein